MKPCSMTWREETRARPHCGSPVFPEEGTRGSVKHHVFNSPHTEAQVQPHARTRRPLSFSALPVFPYVCWHKQPHAYACHSRHGRTLPSPLTAHWAQVLTLRQEMSTLINGQDTPTQHCLHVTSLTLTDGFPSACIYSQIFFLDI